ncbi:PREDICTED: ATP synthase subunit delta, mitochondrial [Galeopterus variegatus]|uniref:ATP synthase F(1) complex subunit delta, mitochondrial n=1 Tax=Galeopterus variegatus TaxID=482537 RepID=A0ABM0QD17_GALVR|nr:PREDICTED: ATP synthase subunit delta, mitochondrial [Galeopterus variegatus]
MAAVAASHPCPAPAPRPPLPGRASPASLRVCTVTGKPRPGAGLSTRERGRLETAPAPPAAPSPAGREGPGTSGDRAWGRDDRQPWHARGGPFPTRAHSLGRPQPALALTPTRQRGVLATAPACTRAGREGAGPNVRSRGRCRTLPPREAPGVTAAGSLSHQTQNPAQAAPAAAAPGQMSFTFASPTQVFFDGANVRQVDVPTLTGAFGILAAHVPTLQVLRPGLVVVHAEDGTTSKYFVSSGSITVNADSSVQLLAEEAVTLDMLDLGAAKANLEKAQSELSGAADEATRAEIQIRIEANEALVKALE